MSFFPDREHIIKGFSRHLMPFTPRLPEHLLKLTKYPGRSLSTLFRMSSSAHYHTTVMLYYRALLHSYSLRFMVLALPPIKSWSLIVYSQISLSVIASVKLRHWSVRALLLCKKGLLLWPNA